MIFYCLSLRVDVLREFRRVVVDIGDLNADGCDT